MLTRKREQTTVRNMVPIVVGSFNQRALIQPNSAAIATRTLMSWSIGIEQGATIPSVPDGPGGRILSRQTCQQIFAPARDALKCGCIRYTQTQHVDPSSYW